MYRLTDSFPYLLNRVGVRMGELFERRIEPYGVTLPMYRVMAALCEISDQRLGDLAAMTTIGMSTLSRLVGGMKRTGLVSRRRSKDNGRSVAISLTAKGRALAEELMPIARHFEEVAVRDFATGDVARINAMLTAVYSNLDAIEPEIDAAIDRKPVGAHARSREAASAPRRAGRGEALRAKAKHSLVG